ncbi:hypothetical protein DF141_08985 [Burkholderia cenocepacia]|nr:hypothetical protein CFB44_23325 [Burkholderia sp. AU31280]RQU77965.1 hypothetical protein DF141_08985 [Burkholderia cenocepacia]RQV09144.1 hypothetical protein DF039_28685 [Burkholderia cenocepacia]RQV61426.1 hypothetical protein DF024_19795 [Burkholderia cenocepacia]RQZ98536.1 hypothetical protein DF058_04370 [Burkholderia cenocepacia]
MAARVHAHASHRPSPCRIGVHRAPSARTAMSHGDSAAAHHICASVHRDGERAMRRLASRAVRQALCDEAFGRIRADMARRLRKLVRADQRRFARSTEY